MTAPPGDPIPFTRPWFDEREAKAVQEALRGHVSTLLRLPLHPLLTPGEIDRVIAAMRETAP